MRLRVPIRRFTGLTAALALSSFALTACGSSSSGPQTGGASKTPAAAPTPAALSTDIPAGTVLRVGDQLDNIKNVLRLGKQDSNFRYKVAYSAFIGGPLMLQAFQAGKLDTGAIGSTPLIFAQAGKQQLVAVTGQQSKTGYQLVTAPGGHGVTGWASLKGKKVAYQQGTALEAALLTGLDSVGLKLSDVTTVNVPVTQISSALQGGSADAGISVEPLTSVYLAANPTGKVAVLTTALTGRSNFIITSQDALKDPAKAAALGDYISRLVKAYAYLRAHPDLYTKAIYVDQYHLTPARAAVVAKAVGVPSFTQLPGEVAAAQQKLADLFAAAGEIPSKIDTSADFDARFNGLVQKAQSP